jgi:hypothetical protein
VCSSSDACEAVTVANCCAGTDSDRAGEWPARDRRHRRSMPVLWSVSSGCLSGDDYTDHERQLVWVATGPHLGLPARLCRMVAFTLNTGCPGNISGEGAWINRKRRTKPVEESGSMRLLAW